MEISNNTITVDTLKNYNKFRYYDHVVQKWSTFTIIKIKNDIIQYTKEDTDYVWKVSVNIFLDIFAYDGSKTEFYHSNPFNEDLFIL